MQYATTKGGEFLLLLGPSPSPHSPRCSPPSSGSSHRVPFSPSHCDRNGHSASRLKQRDRRSELRLYLLARGLTEPKAALRAARSEVMVFALVVDAKDEPAEAFYRHHGFANFGILPRQLNKPQITSANTLPRGYRRAVALVR